MTLGVGFWGALRPIVAALIAAVPFLFLGQHFNRKHQKGLDFALLQSLLHSLLCFGLFCGLIRYLMHGEMRLDLLPIRIFKATKFDR